jgi:hypothetical protein
MKHTRETRNTTGATAHQTRRRRAWPWGLVAVGALVAGSSVVWTEYAVPSLVKYPGDVDTTLDYEGTFTLFVDPSSAAPLAAPSERDLAVERHVYVVESDDDLAVVREVVTIRVDGLPDAVHDHQYVIDRRTMQNVADPRAWAFEETNVLDRTGTYRVNFPMKLDPGTVLPSYKDETATRLSVATDDAVLGEKPNGVEQVVMRSEGTNVPLTATYLAALDEVVPLPRSLTLLQLQPALLAAGVDVDATLTALVPVISQEDLSVLGALAGNPIPLQYVISYEGVTTVNPVTGTVLDVQGISETVSALPAPTALPPLLDVLGRYTEVPEVVAALEGLEAMSSSPIPVFRHDYALTDASLDEVSSDVAAAVRQIRLAETYVPTGLAVLGFVVAVIGLVFVLRRRPVGTNGPTAGEPVDGHVTELSDHDLAALLTSHELVLPGADGRPIRSPGA